MRYAVTPDPGSRARRDEVRMRETDRSNRRAFDALAGSNIAARHTWWGSGNIVANAAVPLNLAGHWASSRNGGIAVFQPLTDFDAPGFFLTRPGRWSARLDLASDATFAGTMRIELAHGNATSGLFDGISYLRNTQSRNTGYSGSGYLDQSIDWVGPVFDTDTPSPLLVTVTHFTGGSTTVPCSWRLQLSFLGDMTVAEQAVIAPVDTVPQDDAAAGTTASG